MGRSKISYFLFLITHLVSILKDITSSVLHCNFRIVAAFIILGHASIAASYKVLQDSCSLLY